LEILLDLLGRDCHGLESCAFVGECRQRKRDKAAGQCGNRGFQRLCRTCLTRGEVRKPARAGSVSGNELASTRMVAALRLR